MAHQLYRVIADVEKTHSGLGNALAFAAICVKARMCLLFVAPAGTGKSVIGRTIGQAYSDTVSLDSVTRSGLKDFKEHFTNFNGLVVIDDMGKIDSLYSRTHTVTSFAELCYSHFISKHTYTMTIEISNFQGSAILNVQPPVLAQLYNADEWEVVTQDKTVRYYHLYRPKRPMASLPECHVDWGISLDLVHKPRHDYKLYSKLEKIASIQWSDARVLEHLDTLLRATAALDRRSDTKNEDYQLLARLMKPMSCERYLVTKTGFEVGRYFNTNLMAVLVEFASWPNVNVERIARDYKVSPTTVYRLLAEIKEWFIPSEPMSKLLVPKKELVRVLKEAGVER